MWQERRTQALNALYSHEDMHRKTDPASKTICRLNGQSQLFKLGAKSEPHSNS
jgi:hypothetical protein